MIYAHDTTDAATKAVDSETSLRWAPLRPFSLFGLLCALLLVLAMSLAGCGKKPASNTPEYAAAHGIESGKTNHLSLGDTRFSIPPEVGIQAETLGEIVPGRADALWLYLPDIAPAADPSASQVPAAGDHPKTIRIHFMQVHNDVEYTEPLDQSRGGVSVRTLNDLGLRAYRDSGRRGDWGAVSYEALDPADRTPMGNPIQLLCGPDSDAACMSTYRLNAHIVVNYVFDHRDIATWRQRHRHVVESIRQFTQ
jgi:predicted small lipoprotein YifL